MGLVNLKKAYAAYDSEPMKGNIERLIDFDDYHCLLSGGLSALLKLQHKYMCLPSDYLKWVAICDGGLLFDTVLLSTEEHDRKLNLDFDTYDDMNSEEARLEFNLPIGFVVFAMRSYGDPVCFNSNEKDGKVYLWDVDNGEFSDIWDSFVDWLTEEIDDGVKLIAEDLLEPLEIKIGGDVNA